MNNNLINKAQLGYLKAILSEYTPAAIALAIKDVVENKIHSVSPVIENDLVAFQFYKNISLQNVKEEQRVIIFENLKIKKENIRDELFKLLDLDNKVAIEIDVDFATSLVPFENQKSANPRFTTLRHNHPSKVAELQIKINLIFPEELLKPQPETNPRPMIL